MVLATHSETAQDILYRILGGGSSPPLHLEFDAPGASNDCSSLQCDEPEIVPPATPNSAAVDAPLEPPQGGILHEVSNKFGLAAAFC